MSLPDPPVASRAARIAPAPAAYPRLHHMCVCVCWSHIFMSQTDKLQMTHIHAFDTHTRIQQVD